MKVRTPMFTSTEDARSDLFLSAAVYLVGPVVIEILRNLLRLDRIPGMTTALFILMPLLTTAAVPMLLMRYRKESFGQYGYGAGLPPNFGIGLLLASPIIVASVLAVVVAGGDVLSAIGIAAVLGGGALQFVVRLLTWLGLGFLAVYATVKARDAFRSDYRTVRDEAIWLGRVLAGVAAVAVSIALLLTLPGQQGPFGGGLGVGPLVVLPLGVAGSVVLLVRTLRGPSATSRATMLTPVVLLALGPLQLSFNATALALGIWQATLYAGIGLIIGALQESRRSALAGLGLTLALALFTPL